MASAWGKSWGLAFGVAWGVVSPSIPTVEPVSAYVIGGGQDVEDGDEYRVEVEKIIKNTKRRQIEEEEVLAAIINFVLEQA